MSLLFLQNIGGGSMILIIAVILIFFGGKKIPVFMLALGNGIREFNEAKNKVKDEIEKGIKDDKSETEK